MKWRGVLGCRKAASIGKSAVLARSFWPRTIGSTTGPANVSLGHTFPHGISFGRGNMSRGILIAGNESALIKAVEIEAKKRVEHCTFVSFPNRFSSKDEKPGSGSRREPVQDASAGVFDDPPETAGLKPEWSPGSPISAHTLVLAAENRLGRVSEAILVCDPPQVSRTTAVPGFADIEVLTNDYIKSWFFLTKELTAYFRAKGEGTLALVCPDKSGKDKEDETDLPGSTALAVFRSLTRSLLASATNEPYITMGFTGNETGDDTGFASFIFKNIDENNRRNNGKLLKFGKVGFFR